MKIFITGGNGYIGINLRRHLQEMSCPYVNYDLTVGFDVLDKQKVYQKMYGCDAVVHLAGVPRVTYCERNVEEAVEVHVYGTSNIVENAALHRIPVVFASTFAAKSAHNVYGMTKRLAERIVLNRGGVVLRFANVYGGLGYMTRKHTALASFVDNKNHGMKATIFGDGSATRDFIHVDDVCRAIINAMSAPPGVYEICTGKQTSIKELADMIGVEYDFADERRGDIKTVGGEPPSMEALGWTPEITLKKGLEELMK